MHSGVPDTHTDLARTSLLSERGGGSRHAPAGDPWSGVTRLGSRVAAAAGLEAVGAGGDLCGVALGCDAAGAAGGGVEAAVCARKRESGVEG